MGLRDYLMNLQAAQESTGGFAKTAEAMRQKAGKEAFAAELPGLIQGGDINAIAQKGMQYGDNTVMEQLTKQMIAQQMGTPGAKRPMTEEEIKARVGGAASPEQIKTIFGMKEQGLQEGAIGDIFKQGSLSEKQREFNTSEERRKEAQATGIFDKQFGKLKNDLYDTRVDLDTMKTVLETGNVPAQGTILSMVSRKIAGEKGVLTDADIARLKSPTLGETIGSFRNYITNNSEETWPPEVKDAIAKMVDVADSRYKDIVATKLVGTLNVAKGSKLLFDPKTEKANAMMEDLADQYGIKYNPKTKKYELPPAKKTEFVLNAPVMQRIPENLRNNSDVLDVVSAWEKKGKAMPEEMQTQFLNSIGVK